MADDRTSVADSIRYHLNGLATEEDPCFQPNSFAALAEQKIVEDRDQIAVFVDCSKSEDAVAIYACGLDDIYLFAPAATIRAVLDQYDVQWLGIDPTPAEDETEALYWRPAADRGALHRDSVTSCRFGQPQVMIGVARCFRHAVVPIRCCR